MPRNGPSREAENPATSCKRRDDCKVRFGLAVVGRDGLIADAAGSGMARSSKPKYQDGGEVDDGFYFIRCRGRSKTID
jgi:hypothetical protein